MSKKQHLVYKSLEISVKSFDKIKGIFTGYASSFGNVDKMNDTMLSTAFDTSIAAYENGSKEIGVNYDHFCAIELASNLLSMTKDDYGLLVSFQVSDEAKQMYQELYAKMIAQAELGKLYMSIGGYVLRSMLGEDRWIRKEIANANDTIEEFDLDHIAVTQYPVDTNAKMMEVKSRMKEMTSVSKTLDDVDGEVSAIKYLMVNKSQMSNTSAKSFVLHLKSMWKKELDNKSEGEEDILQNTEVLGNESQGNDNVSEDGDEDLLSQIGKYL
jgi:HK97 family phage prohead protease